MTQDYPVTCPVGTTLDTECAYLKTKIYGEALALVTKNFTDAVIAATEALTEAIVACNGEKSCVSAAKSSHSDTITSLVASYDVQRGILKANYENGLKDCCKKNREEKQDQSLSHG